jgi:proteasome lid subunit RPN8/RPN11
MLHAEYMAAKKNYRIIGIYHSHTDCEAVPSDMDQRFAIPELSYPIISVKKRRIDHLHSWEKSSTGCDVFVPEIIRITN